MPLLFSLCCLCEWLQNRNLA